MYFRSIDRLSGHDTRQPLNDRADYEMLSSSAASRALAAMTYQPIAYFGFNSLPDGQTPTPVALLRQ
jgi:hypothetical protein